MVTEGAGPHMTRWSEGPKIPMSLPPLTRHQGAPCMRNCPTPPDAPYIGVWADHGVVGRCWNIQSLRELENLLDDSYRVRFRPGFGELTTESVRGLIRALGGFLLIEGADGVVEIRRRGWHEQPL